jgi:pentatricopeptide repeat protein
VDKEDMSTETLAEIYVKQGNYPKAIKIYEQLMLSNPEKKLFFASRIKYIKLKTQP